MPFSRPILLVAGAIFLLLLIGGVFLFRKTPTSPTSPTTPPSTTSPSPRATPFPTPGEITPKPATLQGNVQKLGISIYMQGTHTLKKDGKILALLTSQTINLDHYLNKEVEVSGDALPTVEGNKIIIEVKKLTVISAK